MRLIYVDDEKSSIANFEYEIKSRKDVRFCTYFSNGFSALEYAKDNDFDVAFLDIEMPEISGIELAAKINEINPKIVIIFVTAHDKYAFSAYKAGGRAYLLKPYSPDDLEEVFVFLNKMVKNKDIRSDMQEKKSRIFISTFGRFDIVIDGKPHIFKNAKAKELMALLVDNKGGVLTNVEIFSILWEDKAYNNVTSTYVRRTLRALKEELQSIDSESIVEFNRNSTHINMNLYESGYIDCDYYRIIYNDVWYARDYNGYYMSQYSWAEETVFLIEKKIKALINGNK